MRRPNKHDKIAIIGAGAAGIHLAVCLRDRGFHDITLYEASESIGGKCASEDFNGVPVEFGAMMIPNRTAALDFLRRFSVDLVQSDLTFYNASSRTVIGKTTQKLAALAFQGIELSRLNRLIQKYSVPDPLLDKKDARWDDLSLPFAMILRREKLPISLLYLASSLYPYGYGSIDMMPAYYGFEVCRVWLACIPDQKWFFVRNGYQRALEQIAKKSELRIETNTPIVSLQNDGDKVVCTFASSAVHAFDFVMNSVPHRIESSPSSAMFRDVVEHDYHVGVIETVGVKPIGSIAQTTEFQPHHVNMIIFHSKTRGIAPRDSGNELVSYYCCPNYVYKSERLTEQEREEMVRASLRRYYGIVDYRVLAKKTWPYFPQFSPTNIAAGALAEIYVNQGEHRIWNIGASCCFESVPNVIDYNEKLLRRFGL